MQEANGVIAEVTPVTPPHDSFIIIKASALYLLYALVMAAFNRWSPTLPPIIWALFGCASAVGYLLILVYVIRFLTRPLSVRAWNL